VRRQQQGGHIEQFDIRKTAGLLLWTLTETINTLFSVVNFLKCAVTKVLFLTVPFKTLIFHKVM